jgi:predicted aspartyl protease
MLDRWMLYQGRPFALNSEVTPMGMTTIKARIFNPARPGTKIDLTFMLDSGADHSIVPETMLQALGITPHTTKSFFLANGDEMRRKIGEASFEYVEHVTHTPVIFGEEGDSTMIGVTTLEGLGFVFDPFRHELRPMPTRTR